MGKLSGKTALITGAARGIGRAYALRLATLGADVGVIDLDLNSFKHYELEKSIGNEQTVVNEIKKLGVKAIGIEADVSQLEGIKKAVDDVTDKLGDIDILVANAGGGLGGISENSGSEIDPNQLVKVIERNLYGTIFTVKAVIPAMKKKRAGKIVTVSSIAGLVSNDDGVYAHYGAAKAAIVSYTKSLAQDVGRYGITANCIAPGYIGTARLLQHYENEGIEKYTDKVPLGRLGTPDDCANAMEFLVTDMSNYVTGTVIEVTGGAIK